MSWTCAICGAHHNSLPDCFGIEAPWRAFVSNADFEKRVELTRDQCVIDGQEFFVRGHVVIPIHNHFESLAFSVWSSLSENSFRLMCDRWEEPDRANDAPYFGWLCSPISFYPSTLHQKLSVQSRAPGMVPLFTLAPEGHPLALDQQNGISVLRWHEIAHHFLDT